MSDPNAWPAADESADPPRYRLRLYVSGATQSAYNGGYMMTEVDGNTVTYTMGSTATSPATGTIVVHDLNADFTGGGHLQVKGAWYDTSTKKLYLLFVPFLNPYFSSKPTVYRFSVA